MCTLTAPCRMASADEMCLGCRSWKPNTMCAVAATWKTWLECLQAMQHAWSCSEHAMYTCLPTILQGSRLLQGARVTSAARGHLTRTTCCTQCCINFYTVSTRVQTRRTVRPDYGEVCVRLVMMCVNRVADVITYKATRQAWGDCPGNQGSSKISTHAHAQGRLCHVLRAYSHGSQDN